MTTTIEQTDLRQPSEARKVQLATLKGWILSSLPCQMHPFIDWHATYSPLYRWTRTDAAIEGRWTVTLRLPSSAPITADLYCEWYGHDEETGEDVAMKPADPKYIPYKVHDELNYHRETTNLEDAIAFARFAYRASVESVS